MKHEIKQKKKTLQKTLEQDWGKFAYSQHVREEMQQISPYIDTNLLRAKYQNKNWWEISEDQMDDDFPELLGTEAMCYFLPLLLLQSIAADRTDFHSDETERILDFLMPPKEPQLLNQFEQRNQNFTSVQCRIISQYLYYQKLLYSHKNMEQNRRTAARIDRALKFWENAAVGGFGDATRREFV